MTYNASLLPIVSCGWQGPAAEVLDFNHISKHENIIIELQHIGKDTGKTMRSDKMYVQNTKNMQPKLSLVSKSFDRGFASVKRDTNFAFQSFGISHPEELVRAKQ